MIHKPGLALTLATAALLLSQCDADPPPKPSSEPIAAPTSSGTATNPPHEPAEAASASPGNDHAEPEGNPESVIAQTPEPVAPPQQRTAALAPIESPRRSPSAPPKSPQAQPTQQPQASAQPTTPSKPLPTQRGTVVSKPAFSTWLQASGSIPIGTPTNATVVLVAKAPFKCNEQYPYKFKLDPPPAGIEFPNSVVRGMNVSAKRSTLAVPMVVRSKGTKTISGELSFSVCTNEKCLVERERLSLTLRIEAE